MSRSARSRNARRAMKREFLRRAILLAATLLFAAGCATGRQPPLAAPGISREETITLGGWPQTIFIRGRNRANPVLLFIHGGPGLPEMPFSHVNAELERDFTVVHWDQRGAGKSYRPDVPPETMNVEQFVRDADELTRYLRGAFRQKKIYLAGFSWGSLVGALTVARHPRNYRAYIGISQLVSVPKSELLLHRAGIAQALKGGHPEVAAKLRAIGEPPYESRRDERLVNALTKRLQPPLRNEMTRIRALSLALRSPAYSLADDLRVIRGIAFSGKHLEHEIHSRNLEDEVSEIDVPVWFFLGRYDTVLSAPLAAQYLRELRAPRGKHFVWFERADHILHLEEDAQFRAELRRVLAATRGDD